MEISRHKTDFWIKNSMVDVSIKEISGAVSLHFHEFYEIEVILEGAGTYSMDGIHYDIEAGSLFFMSPSSCHSLHFAENTRLINFMFTLDACEPIFLYKLFDAAPHISVTLSQNDLNFVRTLAEEMTRTNHPQYLSAMLNSLLGKVNTLCGVKGPTVKATAMQYALLYVQNHFKEKIYLEDVARKVNYSPNYFSNKFKSYAGVTFQSYVMNLKLSLSEKMLRNTTLSVTEICDQCGFGDFSNFMFYFKRRYGTSPNRYRQEKQTIK